jgi:hypothetical protein
MMLASLLVLHVWRTKEGMSLNERVELVEVEEKEEYVYST